MLLKLHRRVIQVSRQLSRDGYRENASLKYRLAVQERVIVPDIVHREKEM